MRISLVTGLLVTLAIGCVHARGNLRVDKDGAYTNYPETVVDERARRAKRRKHALIAAPLELVGGAAIVALALFAPVTPSESESVTEGLGDAGKELLGRLVLAGVGTGLAVSGVGDGILGLTDPLFRSPLVRDGALVSADRIDLVDPPRAPRLTFHATSILGTHGIGSDAGIGLAHWVGPHLRLRDSVSGEYTIPWSLDGDMHYALAAEIALERVSRREHAGLYPRSAFGAYGGAAWTAIDGEHRASLRGGFLYTMRSHQIRLGTTYVPGVDDLPSIEMNLRMELRTD